MYAVVVYKATQGARVHTLRPNIPDAKLAANRFFETIMMFLDLNLLASGVAILVLPDDYAQEIDGKGIVMLDTSKVIHQIGSY